MIGTLIETSLRLQRVIWRKMVQFGDRLSISASRQLKRINKLLGEEEPVTLESRYREPYPMPRIEDGGDESDLSFF